MIWALTLVSAALATGCASGTILRHLPRSSGAPDYGALATPGFATLTALIGAVAGVLVGWQAAHPALWLALVVPGALQVCIDARTTWLPLRLSQPMWLASAVMIPMVWAVDAGAGLRALVGAVLTSVGFWLVWRLGGIGFGDVRLMGPVGAASAGESWQFLAAAIMVGTALGACHGIMHRLAGNRGAFPYGPSLWAGPFVALLWL